MNGVSNSTTLSVTAALESIAITPANPDLPKGETETFTATGTFADHTTMNLTNDVTWSSTNTGVATISNAPGSFGAASGLATGTSTINAAFEGITGSTTLTVSPAVLISIMVSPASPSIFASTNDQFTATGVYSDNSTQNLTNQVTWGSTAASVASVNSAGLATGLAQGGATITATLNNVTGSAGLSVAPALVKLMSVTTTIKRHKVTKLVLSFNGALQANMAKKLTLYHLVITGKNGVFTGKTAKAVKLTKAVYKPPVGAAPATITLTPSAAFAIGKPVQLTINGNGASGLKDTLGRLIDGNQDGQPGGSAIVLISQSGTVIEA
jgi:hypothetical protein